MAGNDASMRSARRTTDHDEIRRWAEARNGKPARILRLANAPNDDVALRIDFPEAEEDEDEDADREELSWDEFFEQFDEKRLAFVYYDDSVAGEPSRFNELVSRQ